MGPHRTFLDLCEFHLVSLEPSSGAPAGVKGEGRRQDPPGIGHTLHSHLRGPGHHAGVLGRNDDGWSDGVCRAADIWGEEQTLGIPSEPHPRQRDAVGDLCPNGGGVGRRLAAPELSLQVLTPGTLPPSILLCWWVSAQHPGRAHGRPQDATHVPP